MATNTYVALDKVTLTTSIEGEITFNSIPSTYTDLVVVVNARNTTATTHSGLYLYANGNASGIYSWTNLDGNGTTATSNRGTSTLIYTSSIPAASATSGVFGTTIVNIQNYANTTTYKTVISRGNSIGGPLNASVGLYPSTNAITSISLTTGGTGLLVAGSTFSLYGIKADTNSTPKASGGVVSSDANYWYHTFGMSGTFTPSVALTADYLVVAGGGSSGTTQGYSGGGGAGGVRCTVGATGGGGSLETALSLTATGYTVTVGAGGAAGSSGSNSVFSTITSTGGGMAGYYNGSVYVNGLTGGSGGGGGDSSNGGAGTANQGYAGGNGNSGPSGGGGGAGAVGGTPSGTGTVAGGIGIQTSISGTATYYAGGGGGSSQQNGLAGGTGGLGGGGAGALGNNGNNGVAGTANTGGGAGGCSGVSSGSAGGSGIVIIRYAK